MRFIPKGPVPPQSIREFLNHQLPIKINLDYAHGFGRQHQLCEELTAEQCGLCAYTGAPIDERITGLQPPPQNAKPVRFRAHNEHLKPQSACRQELIDRGLEPGRVVGDDMDYRNIVAALLVEGSSGELFGAAARANESFPVWPTHLHCETHFRFDRNGGINGISADGASTVDVLRLDHETLIGWRRAALDVFLSAEVIQTREDVEMLINKLDQPQEGQLVEYCFCIKNVASTMVP